MLSKEQQNILEKEMEANMLLDLAISVQLSNFEKINEILDTLL